MLFRQEERRGECVKYTRRALFTSDCGNQWHMKYERQQHSSLFIALQGRKRKIEKVAASYTLHIAGIIFSYSKEGLHPVLKMHICHSNGSGQAGSYLCPFHSEETDWIRLHIHRPSVCVLPQRAKPKLGASAGRGFVFGDNSNPSVPWHCSAQFVL